MTGDHRNLYKNAGRTTADFRESLRKKCLERLRDMRFDRQNVRRNLDIGMSVTQLIEEEVADAMEGASFEERQTMCKNLQDIPLQFEEYEASLAQGEEAMAKLLDPDALCPKCKWNPMDVDHTGCLCRVCGFGYAFPSGSTLNTEELSNRLFGGFHSHSDSGCEHLPDPVIQSEGLFFHCGHCDYFTKIV